MLRKVIGHSDLFFRMANLPLRNSNERFSPHSVSSLMAAFGFEDRQFHCPGSIPIPSEYQLASHVYLNDAPGLIVSVSMEIGFPAHATDRSSVQVSFIEDLSKFLKVQTVGLLQQRPPAKAGKGIEHKITTRLKCAIIVIIMLPKPQELRPR